MKYILILFLFLFLPFNNCSLNKDSKYWSEVTENKKNNKNKISDILKKTDDITTMTTEEYKIFIDDYTKKSKYPDISQ